MKNDNTNNTPKVTVIAPIYKVGRFIERCAESLLSQSLQDVEFLFINDATPDDSIEILNKVIDRHPERKDQVRILTHEHNKGLPAARNTGLAEAKGEFVFHCDSDDFVETNMLQEMYDKAIAEDADIVYSDYFLSFEKSEKHMKQPSYDTPIQALRGMLHGKMKYNVWNKLVRRSLYDEGNVRFPDGYSMGEDMTMMLLFVYARKVAYIPKAFYHYVQFNTNSITASYSDKHLEALHHNSLDIEQKLRAACKEDIDLDLACIKLDQKWPFLLNGKRSMFKLWRKWFPETNKYIWKNPEISKRICFVEWCAVKNQFWIIWLHYWIICRFYYGIVYK